MKDIHPDEIKTELAKTMERLLEGDRYTIRNFAIVVSSHEKGDPENIKSSMVAFGGIPAQVAVSIADMVARFCTSTLDDQHEAAQGAVSIAEAAVERITGGFDEEEVVHSV